MTVAATITVQFKRVHFTLGVPYRKGLPIHCRLITRNRMLMNKKAPKQTNCKTKPKRNMDMPLRDLSAFSFSDSLLTEYAAAMADAPMSCIKKEPRSNRTNEAC
jgi:hypothetical protein